MQGTNVKVFIHTDQVPHTVYPGRAPTGSPSSWHHQSCHPKVTQKPNLWSRVFAKQCNVQRMSCVFLTLPLGRKKCVPLVFFCQRSFRGSLGKCPEMRSDKSFHDGVCICRYECTAVNILFIPPMPFTSHQASEPVASKNERKKWKCTKF